MEPIRRWWRSFAVQLGSVAILAAAALAQKPAVLLSGAGAKAYESSICSSGDRVYVAWDEETGPLSFDVLLNRSLDAGRTWLSSPVRINTVSYGSNSAPGVALACNGDDVYVAWSGAFTGSFSDIYFSRSTDGGLTWSAARRLDTDRPGANDSFWPEICVAGSVVYVVWEETRNSLWDEIRFNRSLDGGATWLGDDVRLSNSPATHAADPKIACDGNRVFVVWHVGDVFLPKAVHFNRSLDAGSTWLQAPIQIDEKTRADDFSHRVAVSGNDVYVVWADRRNGPYAIYFDHSSDQGATWRAHDTRISGGTGHAFNPRLSEQGGSLHVVWDQGNNVVRFNRSSDHGATWQSESPRLNSLAGATNPELCVANGINVVWRNNGGVYSNRSMDGGNTWLTREVRLDNGQSTVFAHALHCDGGNVAVSWNTQLGLQLAGPVHFNIPYGFQPYGAGTAGSAGLVPALTTTGTATIGSAFSLEIATALGGAPGAMLIGAAPANLSILGGTVLVTPAVAPAFTLGGAAGVPGAGTLSLPLTIPNDESLVGVPLYFQALILDPGAAGSVSMTDAREMMIG